MNTPEIPKSEYAERVEKVRGLMRKHDVEAVFVYTDELQMANACYLTGHWPIIEPAAAFVPLTGDPLLLVGPEAGTYASEISAIQDLRIVDCFIVPEEEYPGAVILPLADVFKDAVAGKNLRRLGLVGYDTLPYGLMEALKDAAGGAQMVDMTRDFEVMRAVKSEAEIAMEAFSFEAGLQGLRAGAPLIKPGVTEFEVIGAAEGRMRSMGIDGFNFRGLCASGPRSNGVVPPATTKKMQADELLLFGFSPKYRGYTAGVSCTYAVQHPPSKEQMQFLGHLAETLKVTAEALKPGMLGKEVDAVPRSFLTDLGYGKYLSMGVVHTVGLNEFERPFFGPNSEDVLELNTTVCIDVSMFHHPVFHGCRIEAGYVIREHGAEPLSQNLHDYLLSLRDPDGLWSEDRS